MASKPKDVPQHYYTLEEFSALEDASDARFEYWDGDIVCMSGGSRAHETISSNVHGSLYMGLRGGRCRAFTGDAPIWTPTLPPYRYPDASAACGEPKFEHIERAACEALRAARERRVAEPRGDRPRRPA